MRRPGYVWLGGAGPGDPELLTRKTIHKLMIRAARRGRRVVRLKCGDPFVLGRGGEEALAVAGVPFEVVPGVTTAVAASALAGVPVTHRGLASGFAVVSGLDEQACEPILRSLPADSLTVVVLMGLRTRDRLAATLIESGWAAARPAAIFLGASTASHHAWTGTLDTLATAPVPAQAADLPGTIGAPLGVLPERPAREAVLDDAKRAAERAAFPMAGWTGLEPATSVTGPRSR